jgi:predicted dehydrogenase
MGVHEFDQLRWLTGQNIASLAAVSSGEAPTRPPTCLRAGQKRTGPPDSVKARRRAVIANACPLTRYDV